ncbi:hypothetical protein [Holdemania sp. Marseille-P2844]|nr:hypothetical protein [Holdemania sp. Marseille-P2844]
MLIASQAWFSAEFSGCPHRPFTPKMQAVPSQKLKVKKSDIFTFFQEES